MLHRFRTCVVLLFSAFLLCETKYTYITWNQGEAVISETYFFEDIPSLHVARATYSNEINSTGWAFLELHTSSSSSDEQQAYSAGYLEGFLTRDLIFMHWQNMIKGYCYNKTDVCGLIDEFVDKNEQYISHMVKNNPQDPYWHQLKLYYIQIEGLAMGYNAATKHPYHKLSIRDIVWMNMLGDLDDLAFALSMPPDTPEDLLFGQHCTGLVKLLPDFSELYVSQVTWNSYQSMLRIQKKYVLNYRLFPGSDHFIPGRKMSLSSYPAFVQSTDDFYIISSGLVAAETTISNSNRSLFKYIKPVGQGSAMGAQLHLIAPLLKECLGTPKVDPEVKLKVFTSLSTVLLKRQTNFASCDGDKLEAFLKIIINEVIIPNLVWAPGRTAEAIRTAAVACLCAALQDNPEEIERGDGDKNVKEVNLFPTKDSLEPFLEEIIPLLTALCDDNSTLSRRHTLRAMCCVATRAKQLDCFTPAILHKVYFGVLKRLDDSSDKVRSCAVQTIRILFKNRPDSYDTKLYGAHIDALYNAMLIHLDDNDEEFRKEMLDALLDLSSVDPTVLMKKVKANIHLYRNKNAYERLTSHLEKILQ